MAADADTLIPPELLPKIRKAAKEERRAPRELVGEALETYLEDRRRRLLYSEMEAHARVLGLTEDDVPRLIAEFRREARGK